MKIKSVCALVALIFSGSSAVMAEDSQDKRWYFSPSLSYIIADSDRDADDGFGVQLGFGKPVSKSWNIEFSAVADSLDFSNINGEYDQTGLGIDGLYFFNRNSSWTPYGIIGVGALKTDVPGNDSTNTMATIGLGLMTKISDHGTTFRIDARNRLDDDDESIPTENRFTDWIVNLGLSIPFGKIDKAPVVRDGDNDGVADNLDKCPGTAAGLTVNSYGCEVDSDNDGVVDSKDSCPETKAGKMVDASGCEIKLDSDKDGVIDENDRCPTTPLGTKVDKNGCELDSDNDGVVDGKDRCPDSKAGDKVDNEGCLIIADPVTLRGVTFATNSSILTKSAEQVLDGVAETLRNHPEIKVEIAGYTDDRGSRSYNVDLSQRRTESVRQYLISQGVNKDNLAAKGYGPDNPIADNSTKEGRALNRRVELHVLSQ